MTDWNDLKELARLAKAHFDNLSPEEQFEEKVKQYASWTYGQLRLSGRDVTKEECLISARAFLEQRR